MSLLNIFLQTVFKDTFVKEKFVLIILFFLSPGGTSLGDCQACTGGYYCALPGLDAPSGPCAPGF